MDEEFNDLYFVVVIVRQKSASHYLCYCNYFAITRTEIWGPTDIDCANSKGYCGVN